MADFVLIAPALALGAAAFVELFIRLGVMTRVAALNDATTRALSLVKAERVSDHWKERMLPVYAGRIFSASMLVTALIFAGVAAFLAIVQVGGMAITGAGFNAIEASAAPAAVIFASIAGGAFAFVRMRRAHG